MDKFEALKKIFGYENFRKGQEEVIESLLDNKDSLAIMPTGAGKSICYQIPAILKEGITIVVSPLISLMNDQVRQLTDVGIESAFLNSSLTDVEFRNTLIRAYRGNYKLIYVAPERVVLDTFVKFSNAVNISMLIIDEAHCISQWGPDFRPAYLKICEYMQKLEKRPVIGAFTATATSQVKQDIISSLTLKNPTVVANGYDRKNLYFVVEPGKNKKTKIINYLRKNEGKSGIIYASTKVAVEQVCEMLCENGFKATRYHAGLSSEEKEKNHEDFLYDRKNVMVATNAFGMGINKSNVNYVIHYNMPKDIEAYYQEAGRAGRDGSNAQCILFYNGQDYNTQLYFINSMENNNDYDYETLKAIKETKLTKLKSMSGYCKTSECLRHHILRYFGEIAPNTCGNCSNCNSDYFNIDITEQSKIIIKCTLEICKRFPLGETMIVDTLRGSKNQKVDKFKLTGNTYYASLFKLSVDDIKKIINTLYENEYLEKTSEQYPVVLVTQLGNEFLDSEETLIMKVLKQVEEKVVRENTLYNNDLFYKLKELRTLIANERGVPAFIVFHDTTLKDMAEKTPKTKNEMMNVSGVGEYKFSLYGDRFLNLINTYYEINKE